MKRRLTIILSLLLLLSLLSGCAKEVAEVKTVKLGLLEPLSGDYAQQGNYERLGVEYARTVRQEAVIAGENYVVELVKKDTGSTIVGTVDRAKELVSEEVSLVLGCYGSTECNVVAPILREAGISAIGISCDSPSVTLNNSNYYRICYLDSYQGKLLADYAYEYGARVAYCLAQSDRDYDRDMCEYFLEEFQALGGTVITTVTTILYNTYTTNLNNFADYLFGAVTNKADVLFSPIPIKKGAQLIGECAASQVRFIILGDDSWDCSTIGDASVGSYMNVACASIFAEDRNEACASFAQGFRDWLESDPRRIEANGGTTDINPASALAYDAYMVAIDALEAAGTTESSAVGAAVAGVRIQGLTGDFGFDLNGDAARSTLFIKNCDINTGRLNFEKAQASRYPVSGDT